MDLFVFVSAAPEVPSVTAPPGSFLAPGCPSPGITRAMSLGVRSTGFTGKGWHKWRQTGTEADGSDWTGKDVMMRQKSSQF